MFLFYVLLYVALCPFKFCNHLDWKRELIAWLSLSSWCLMIVVWLFLAVPWVCLQFVIVVFPYRTHLLFYIYIYIITLTCHFFCILQSFTLLNRDVAFSCKK